MTIRVETTTDLRACLGIRATVFTEEQGVAQADDVDGLDDEAVQFLLFAQDTPVGTARMLIDGDIGKIGRVAVLKPFRGAGHGKALIEAAISDAHKRALARVKLGARVDAIGFYEGLGFCAVGAVFDDVGIPHQTMVLDL